MQECLLPRPSVLNDSKYLIERAKRGFCLYFSIRQFISVCMPDDYGRTPVPIVVKFGINAFVTQSERRI